MTHVWIIKTAVCVHVCVWYGTTDSCIQLLFATFFI